MPYGGFVCECSNAGLLTIQPVIPIKKNKVSPSLRRQEACHSDEGVVGRGRGEARKCKCESVSTLRRIIVCKCENDLPDKNLNLNIKYY